MPYVKRADGIEAVFQMKEGQFLKAWWWLTVTLARKGDGLVHVTFGMTYRKKDFVRNTHTV